MIKLRTLKNSYARLKEKFSRIITGNEVWSKYMDKLIADAEESLENEGVYNSRRIQRGVDKRI